MSTVILICAGISVLLLIFELVQIVAALSNIRVTLGIIHRDLAMLFETKRKTNPPKQREYPPEQREYWRDQNGFIHVRKKRA